MVDQKRHANVGPTPSGPKKKRACGQGPQAMNMPPPGREHSPHGLGEDRPPKALIGRDLLEPLGGREIGQQKGQGKTREKETSRAGGQMKLFEDDGVVQAPPPLRKGKEK